MIAVLWLSLRPAGLLLAMPPTATPPAQNPAASATASMSSVDGSAGAEGGPSAGEDAIAALAAEIHRLRQQVEGLEDRLAALEAARGVTSASARRAAPGLAAAGMAANRAPGEAQAPESTPGSVGHAQPLSFQRGDLSVALGGYASARYDVNDSPELADSMTLRRLVLTADADIGGRVRVYSEIEFERLSEIELERSMAPEAGGLAFEQELEGPNGGEIAIEQAWGQFRFAPQLALRFGAVLPPVGRFNIRHDDNEWNFPRRPLIDRGANVLPATSAWTEMGLGANGEIEVGEQGLLSYEAYLLNGVGLDSAIEEKVQTRQRRRNKLALEAIVGPASGAFDGSNPADAFAARVQFSPRLGSEIAVSGYRGRYAPEFLDSGGSITTLGVDGEHLLGPLHLEGEFLHTRFGDLDGVLSDFARVALDQATETESDEAGRLESEVEIELEGLSHRRFGFWIDAGLPITVERGWLGLDEAAFIPSVRYERVWFKGHLEELSFANGDVTELERRDHQQERISVGLAFRPAPLAVFHFFWERNNAIQGFLLDPVGVMERSTNGFVFGAAFGF